MAGGAPNHATRKASGYNLWAKVEASIGRYKRVIGDALRSRSGRSETTEVAIAAAALNRLLEFGRRTMPASYEP